MITFLNESYLLLIMFNTIPISIKRNKLERIAQDEKIIYRVERKNESYEFESQRDLFESQNPISSKKNVPNGFAFNRRFSSNHNGLRMYSLENELGNFVYVIGKVNDDCFEITEADSNPINHGDLLKELAVKVEEELKKSTKPISSVRVKVFTPSQYELASEMGFRRAHRTLGDYVAGVIFDRFSGGEFLSDRKFSVYMEKKI